MKHHPVKALVAKSVSFPPDGDVVLDSSHSPLAPHGPHLQREHPYKARYDPRAAPSDPCLRAPGAPSAFACVLYPRYVKLRRTPNTAAVEKDARLRELIHYNNTAKPITLFEEDARIYSHFFHSNVALVLYAPYLDVQVSV